MVEKPALGRAPRFQLGSGGQVRAPCPFALFIADDFKTRVAVSFLGDPKLGGGDGGGQIQQLGVASEVQEHAHLAGFRFLDHLEDEGAVSRMAAHDRHEDHPVRGEVALMQREGGRCRPGRIGPGWFLFHKTANAVRALPRRQLLGETCRWLGAAVGIANERPKGCGFDDGCCRHDSSFRMREIALISLILLRYRVIGGGISAPRWITLFRGQHRRAFSRQVIRQECRKVSFTDAVSHFDIHPLPFGTVLTVQRHEIVPA